MSLVADLGTDIAHACSIHELAGVAVIPVLVHEGALGHGESAQLVVQGLITFSFISLGFFSNHNSFSFII